MKKFLIAALLACAAMPAQAVTLILDANISGSRSTASQPGNPGNVTPIGPFSAKITLNGTWEGGFNSFYIPCRTDLPGGCMKANFEGNDLVLRAPDGSMPCYCSETIRLTFDRPVSFGNLDAVFISGSYNFYEGTYMGSTSLTGNIFAASVPEPATWAMMIAGFGLAGAALRRRSARVHFA